MALSQKGLSRSAVLHTDPNCPTHARHVKEAKAKRVVDRVLVEITRDDAKQLNALGDVWERHWENWKGDIFLCHESPVLMVGASGSKRRVELQRCKGQDFIKAQARINRLDWFWDMRSRKGKEEKQKVKRRVGRARLGKICDRHTITFSPPQMRLIKKLGLDQRQASELVKTLLEKNLVFFQKESGRYLVAAATHADSGIMHWDLIFSGIDPEHNRRGLQSLPKLSNEAWTIGAWRQRSLGCELSPTKAKWLNQNLDRFRERYCKGVVREPILLQMHQKLDADFSQWVKDNGHSEKWEQTKEEYQRWVASTDKKKEAFALERATGTDAKAYAKKIAAKLVMYVLYIVLPPPVFAFVRAALNPFEIVADVWRACVQRSNDSKLARVIDEGRAAMKATKKEVATPPTQKSKQMRAPKTTRPPEITMGL